MEFGITNDSFCWLRNRCSYRCRDRVYYDHIYCFSYRMLCFTTNDRKPKSIGNYRTNNCVCRFYGYFNRCHYRWNMEQQ